jgi:hypothetical protein
MDTVIPPQMPVFSLEGRDPQRNDIIRLRETDTTYIYYRLTGFHSGWHVEVSWVNLETGKRHVFPRLEVISGLTMQALHANAVQNGNLFTWEP